MAKVQLNAQSTSPSAPKSLIHLLAGLLLGVIALVPPANAAGDEVLRAPSGITYVTGGVSLEATERLKGMEKDFNLKLVFSNTTGAYLSAVKVTIVDAGGRVVLEMTTEGPILMAKLAPGGYQINATFAGQVEHQKATVGTDKLSILDFRWAAR